MPLTDGDTLWIVTQVRAEVWDLGLAACHIQNTEANDYIEFVIAWGKRKQRESNG